MKNMAISNPYFPGFQCEPSDPSSPAHEFIHNARGFGTAHAGKVLQIYDMI
jgi:hypothetical protein